MVASVGSSFASGANDAQAETKSALLNCLRLADPGNKIYRVVE
jgi:hypothetical protein